MSSSPIHGEVYLIQHYAIKFDRRKLQLKINWPGGKFVPENLLALHKESTYFKSWYKLACAVFHTPPFWNRKQIIDFLLNQKQMTNFSCYILRYYYLCTILYHRKPAIPGYDQFWEYGWTTWTKDDDFIPILITCKYTHF